MQWNSLQSYFEIEVSVLQALSYCFYEILDNALIFQKSYMGYSLGY